MSHNTYIYNTYTYISHVEYMNTNQTIEVMIMSLFV